MQRSLPTLLACALPIALAAALAFAGDETDSKAATVISADANTPDRAKMDAMLKTDGAANLNPMVKIDAHKAMMKPHVPPPPDGNDLALSCQAEVEGFDAGYCLGVVEGVISNMRVCKKDHSAITLGEAADATARYLSSHPEKLKSATSFSHVEPWR